MPLLLGASMHGPVKIVRGVEEITRYMYLPCSHFGTISIGIATAIGMSACSEKMYPCWVFKIPFLSSYSLSCACSGAIDSLSDMGSNEESNLGTILSMAVCVLPRLGVIALAFTFLDERAMELCISVSELSFSLASNA